MAAAIMLKAGREKSVLRHHPWIFSGAVGKIQGTPPQPGDTMNVYSAQGEWLARAAYSPTSQIVARVWSFEKEEEIDAAFFRLRLEQALLARKALTHTTAYRVVNAESDRLPGVIIDRYGDFLACQFLSTGAEFWKATIVQELAAIMPHIGIYERSDADVREKEGLTAESVGVLAGENPPELIEIQEHGLRFLVDIRRGQKTGFYLDQRENRALLSRFANGAEVLNCFAYTGGFGVYALKHGAKHVTNIESSAEAMELTRQNIELNGLSMEQTELVVGDVFKVLRTYRNAERQFDVVILDPPKFAESKGQLERACRGYKDINWLAMRALRPGGLLLTFSCSGLMTYDLFHKIVADAALDAHRHAQIIQTMTQAEDHPVALAFPEGAYLKGMACRVW